MDVYWHIFDDVSPSLMLLLDVTLPAPVTTSVLGCATHHLVHRTELETATTPHATVIQRIVYKLASDSRPGFKLHMLACGPIEIAT